MTIFESIGKVIMYIIIALVLSMIALGAIIYGAKRDKFADFKKYAIGILVGYAIVVTVLMTYLAFVEIKQDTYLEQNLFNSYLFKPILSMVLIVAIGGVCMFVASLFNKKATKVAGIVTAFGELGAFIATMVYMTKYFNESKIVASDYPSLNTIGLIVTAVIIMVVIAVIYFLGDKHKDESSTRPIVYGAIAIAMSFALSYIRFFKMPNGGSVTFASLLPLMIFCCMFGTRRGVVVCLIYGVLQAIQDPWIIHPMQFLLDYPLAFGLIGISGLLMEKGVFKNKRVLGFIVGGVMAVLLRYVCHVCSGVFAFADYADLDKYSTALAYSFGYNSFAIVDMLIALMAGSVLFGSKAFTSQMVRSSSIASSIQSYSIEYDYDTVENDCDTVENDCDDFTIEA